LDPCQISDSPHHTLQRIDLTNEVPYTKSAKCWIARHNTNGVRPQRNQCRSYAHPRGGVRSFSSGVSAAYNNDVVMFHVKHSLFADAKTQENFV
jgi:hypothetical protein